MRAASCATASIANVVAAMSAMRCAIASCFQTGTPHWTRAADQPRTTSRQCFAMPEQIAGSVNRPVLSVTNATFRPEPSCPIRFSFGTCTSLKLITPFASAFEPHEATAILHLDAGPGTLDHERADLLGFRIARHDHQQLRERTVGAPQLLAVEHVGVAARAPRSSTSWPDRSRREAR